ncbi:MAG: hypothetical protein QM766_19640 [Burkholderiaceae bacterium]
MIAKQLWQARDLIEPQDFVMIHAQLSGHMCLVFPFRGNVTTMSAIGSTSCESHAGLWRMVAAMRSAALARSLRIKRWTRSHVGACGSGRISCPSVVDYKTIDDDNLSSLE